MESNNYYVYVYLDPRKPGDYNYGEFHFDYEPFYVGKGKSGRDKWHLLYRTKNKKFTNKIKKIIRETDNFPIIQRYKENMSEFGALDLEKIMEATIGRQLNGPLCNLYPGGFGSCPSKDTYDEVKQAFEAEGYVLLSKEYLGANKYLYYICPKGHKHRIKWSCWQQGQRCGKCKYGRWHYDGFSYISQQ
jgi:hypothetical protein